MKVRRITLKNWKNFALAEAEIRDRVFLVGPNASGKSNFLDAFRFLRDLASTGGGFQEAISRRGGVTAIRCLAARRYPDVTISVRIEDDAGHSLLTDEPRPLGGARGPDPVDVLLGALCACSGTSVLTGIPAAVHSR